MSILTAPPLITLLSSCLSDGHVWIACSGMSLKGVNRPPTRQKPPPVSLRLENNGKSSEMMKPLEPPSEEEMSDSIHGLSEDDLLSD